MNKILLIFLMLIFGRFCFSQQVNTNADSSDKNLSQHVYHFTKGLMINSASRYGREALYIDPVAFMLYTHTMKTPAEGGTFNVTSEEEAIKWFAVTADSLNQLRARRNSEGFSRGRTGGYIYLTYQSDKQQTALLNIRGNASVIFNGFTHAGDPYSSEWLYIPVQLKKGLNELYVRGQNIKADLIFPLKPVFLNTEDMTLPSIVPNDRHNDLTGGVVLINNSAKALKGLLVKSSIAGKEITTGIPAILPMSTRKIIFHLDGTGAAGKGKYSCRLTLFSKDKMLDEKQITIDVVESADKYSNTFISNIDGSVQYYAVTPQLPSSTKGAALFLSVHGAGVEAIGQARAYHSKDWGTLVAATNRRPRGFNWEDWGRLDALEVLNIAKEKFKPDPQHIYLTGHSMGGHGTWFLGATYPGEWAAIGACSGYPTLKDYGSADGLIPDSSSSPMEQILLRSGNQSDVIKLVTNYKPLGVYILHGDSDKVVPVKYARQMRALLGNFHADMSYYEYPGGVHWFGDQSVDWKPMFDFFKWHSLPVDSAVNLVDFMTANPGISSGYHWVSIWQQEHPLQFSHIQLKRDKTAKTITGITENIRLLKLDLKDFNNGDRINIKLDSPEAVQYSIAGINDSVFLLKEDGKWKVTTKPGTDQKGPHRYGTFKDAFNNHMVFVYGTIGNKEENDWSYNKAKYDAETWYYRGNGAVDIIADKEFSLATYKDRGVILYGNKNTNAAWFLLRDCPIQVERNKIVAAGKTWQGDDLAAYIVWPIRSSAIASVAVIGGTGIKGMNAANANQYFAGASGFPDFMVYKLNMLSSGTDEIKMAGFFDNNWALSGTDFIQKD